MLVGCMGCMLCMSWKSCMKLCMVDLYVLFEVYDVYELYEVTSTVPLASMVFAGLAWLHGYVFLGLFISSTSGRRRCMSFARSSGAGWRRCMILRSMYELCEAALFFRCAGGAAAFFF